MQSARCVVTLYIMQQVYHMSRLRMINVLSVTSLFSCINNYFLDSACLHNGCTVYLSSKGSHGEQNFCWEIITQKMLKV